MKYFNLILIIIIILINYNITKSQTEIPNSDFEEWVTVNNDQGEAMYDDPTGAWWGTLNKLRLLAGPVTVLKTTDAYSGNFAAKLETKAFGTFKIPGLLSAGYFNTQIPNFIEGQPFIAKPKFLKGYYKFTSVNNDSAALYINVSRYNTSTNLTDTIAEGSLIFYQSVSEYTPFNVELKYFINDLIPDTIKLTFVTCAGVHGLESTEKAQIGTTLFIDKLSLEYISDIPENSLSIDEIELSYGKLNDCLYIKSKNIINIKNLKLYNYTGNLVFEKHNLSNNYIDLSSINLYTGIYFYRVITDNNKIYNGKIVIN